MIHQTKQLRINEYDLNPEWHIKVVLLLFSAPEPA